MHWYARSVEKDGIDIPNMKSDSSRLEELAVFQDVSPITDFDALLGHPSSEDESAEEFSAMLREWRREGAGPAPPQ